MRLSIFFGEFLSTGLPFYGIIFARTQFRRTAACCPDWRLRQKNSGTCVEVPDDADRPGGGRRSAFCSFSQALSSPQPKRSICFFSTSAAMIRRPGRKRPYGGLHSRHIGFLPYPSAAPPLFENRYLPIFNCADYIRRDDASPLCGLGSNQPFREPPDAGERMEHRRPP